MDFGFLRAGPPRESREGGSCGLASTFLLSLLTSSSEGSLQSRSSPRSTLASRTPPWKAEVGSVRHLRPRQPGLSDGKGPEKEPFSTC